MKRASITASLLMLTMALAAPVGAAQGHGQLYACGEAGDAELYVEIDLFNADLARYYVVIMGDNAILSGPPTPITLTKTDTSGNARYVGEGATFTAAGAMGSLNEGDVSSTCRLTDRNMFVTPPAPEVTVDPRKDEVYDKMGLSWIQTPLDVQGMSWGGILREGPGVEYAKIGSLQNGQSLTMTGETDRMYQGLPWYAVRLDNGQTGYHWGGIICDPTGIMQGTFNQGGCP